MHYDLLLLLQPLHNTDRNLEHIRNNIRRRERQPLRQTHIRHTLGFVNLNKRQVLCSRGVLDVVSRVIGENGGVARFEVEGARVGVAGEDGGACGA